MRRILITLVRPSTYISRWVVALLLIVTFVLAGYGYFAPIEQLLSTKAFTFEVGSFTISVYQLLKALVALIALMWLASMISAAGEQQLKQMRKIKASTRALVVKGFQITVYFLIFMVALDMLGIDLTALTVLGGAIGIGIGFGLQKITSNFISGLILLFEKSVEEEDLVELSDGTYGFVKHTGARYTLIETFDSKEIMIPNEDFITNRVTNWTYSNKHGRVEVPIGVSYDCDIEKAHTLILEAAREHPRCIDDPEPKCYLREYGDSSVNFLLHFWVADVTEGRFEPQSDVMRSIWKKFKKHKITIPFPQRDLHIKTPEVFKP